MYIATYMQGKNTMFNYELQEFEALALALGTNTIGDTPLVSTNERRQVRFVFNLDWNNTQDRTIGQYLNWFKERRKMTQILRDAVRLYVDLLNGRTDVLCELFPGIVAKLQAQNTDRVGQALQSLAQSQAMMAEAMMSKPQSAPAPPSPIIFTPDLTEISPPDDDDLPALTITKAKSDGQAGGNFLASCMNLQQ